MDLLNDTWTGYLRVVLDIFGTTLTPTFVIFCEKVPAFKDCQLDKDGKVLRSTSIIVTIGVILAIILPVTPLAKVAVNSV